LFDKEHNTNETFSCFRAQCSLQTVFLMLEERTLVAQNYGASLE